MKIVSVDSAVCSVPGPRPIALELSEHRLAVAHVVPRPDPADGLIAIPDRPGRGMTLAPDAERKSRLR